MLLCYSQACHNEEIEDSHDNDDKNQPIWQKLSSLLISIISNQEPLKYGTAMNLGLIPTEDGARSSVLTSSFKVNEYGKCKLENKHHSGARYLSLPELVGNASCHPSFCNKPRVTQQVDILEVLIGLVQNDG